MFIERYGSIKPLNMKKKINTNIAVFIYLEISFRKSFNNRMFNLFY